MPFREKNKVNTRMPACLCGETSADAPHRVTITVTKRRALKSSWTGPSSLLQTSHVSVEL